MHDSDQKLHTELRALSDTLHPDAAFVDALEQRLLTHTSESSTKGNPPMFRWRKFTALAATLAVVLLLMLFVPALRSWAQDMLDYFRRAEGDTFPVEPMGPPDAEDAEPSGADAYYASAVPLAEVQDTLDFTLLIPSNVPPGYALLGADPTSTGDFVSLIFSAPAGRMLLINEWPVDSVRVREDESTWNTIGQSADVEVVDINGVRGEYVAGGWAVFPGSDQAKWLPDSSQRRLRWQAGDVIVEIWAMGGSVDDLHQVYGDLSRGDVLVLAESMQ